MTADAPVACVERAESQAYVAAVRERALGYWKPDGIEPGSEVVIAFRLDEQGQLVRSEVRGSASKSESFAARRALGGGAPYPPMPDTAKCLAGLEASITFRAPDAAAPAKPRRVETPPPSPQAEELARVSHWRNLIALAVLLVVAARYVFVRRTVEGLTSSDPDARGAPVALDRDFPFFARRGSFENGALLVTAHLALILWHSPEVLAFFALLDLAAIAELVHSRRSPLVRLGPAEIAVDSSVFVPTRRIASWRVASWAMKPDSLLGLRDVDGNDVRIPLHRFRHDDADVIAFFVRGLQLVGAGQRPLTLGELTRRERLAGFVVLALALTVAVIETLVHL